jgi:hypothetical protein
MSSRSLRLVRSCAGGVALVDALPVRRRATLAIEPLAPSQQERRLFCFSAGSPHARRRHLAKELIEI